MIGNRGRAVSSAKVRSRARIHQRGALLTTSAKINAAEAAERLEFGTLYYWRVDLDVGAERDAEHGCGKVHDDDASVDVLGRQLPFGHCWIVWLVQPVAAHLPQPRRCHAGNSTCT